MALLGSVLTAWAVGVPSMVVSAMDTHNDARYVSMNDHQAQIYQGQMSNFNERIDTLEWRQYKADDPEEKALLEQQKKKIEREQQLYREQYQQK